MNLKKTLYNIHLSNNNFFNIRNGKIKYEIEDTIEVTKITIL
jgi:hypothetical protein